MEEQPQPHVRSVVALSTNTSPKETHTSRQHNRRETDSVQRTAGHGHAAWCPLQPLHPRLSATTTTVDPGPHLRLIWQARSLPHIGEQLQLRCSRADVAHLLLALLLQQLHIRVVPLEQLTQTQHRNMTSERQLGSGAWYRRCVRYCVIQPTSAVAAMAPSTCIIV